MGVMQVRVRPLVAADEPELWELVYQAIYLPTGTTPPPRSIVQHPRIACYVQEWGQAGDRGVGAEDPERPGLAGAAWLRLLQGKKRGYGYVSDLIPELTIALHPRYRGAGLGTRLLQALEAMARPHYPGISLSVAPQNPALRLYQRLGWRIVEARGSSLVLVKQWQEG